MSRIVIVTAVNVFAWTDIVAPQASILPLWHTELFLSQFNSIIYTKADSVSDDMLCNLCSYQFSRIKMWMTGGKRRTNSMTLNPS
jgi:hypothetical protein